MAHSDECPVCAAQKRADPRIEERQAQLRSITQDAKEPDERTDQD